MNRTRAMLLLIFSLLAGFGQAQDLIITFSITDFYYPFFSAEENQKALDHMFDDMSLTGHYFDPKTEFRWSEGAPGIGGFFHPHFQLINPQGDHRQLLFRVQVDPDSKIKKVT